MLHNRKVVVLGRNCSFRHDRRIDTDYAQRTPAPRVVLTHSRCKWGVHKIRCTLPKSLPDNELWFLIVTVYRSDLDSVDVCIKNLVNR